ncbi:MAG TPA: hypothetical protein VK785_06485 [Opitutaceae bacterium]|jgi:hypothetical protein|nr:hypothetical protein [Opitutaceae bacterium]
MNTEISSRFATVARVLSSPSSLSLPAAFGEQLEALYGLVQRSDYVFGSPLGPFHHQSHRYHLPRFVYFGPQTSEASLRLAFFAGFDQRDLRGTLSLLHFVERLALKPDIGQGLNLSFFPLIDVLGLTGLVPGRELARENWARTTAPELSLLEKDARLRGYHGFVRLETALGDDVVTVRLRTAAQVENPTPGVELITSEDITPFAVRWESTTVGASEDGPLASADDLPFQPFELTLRLPGAWAPELHREATASILKRFVLRYRGLIAYGQHL